MANKQKVKPGDLFAIFMQENKFAVGIILHVSKRINNGIMVGLYNQTFRALEEIDLTVLGGEFIFTPNYTGKQSFTSGHWKVLGNSQNLLAEAKIPLLQSAGFLYDKDTEIKKVAREEENNYPTLIAYGEKALENKLRKELG